jgi:hypothetical protein
LSDRSRAAAAASLAAVVAFLPFLRGTLAGARLYFRDLSLHFFPLRRLALDGLARGELVFWNPFVHEGVPLPLPALGYPLDLLPLVGPGDGLVSLVLALHVPLAAVFFFRLARGLGLRVEAACGGALAYALGGFVLSTVNLYVYLQAAAWAPLVVLGLVRLQATGRRRALAVAALAVAIALTTTGVEIVAQAIVAGVVLGFGRRRALAASTRLLGALGLGAALAAPVLVLVAGQVAASARGQGFTTDVVLAHSVHPFALVQTVVADLFGNLGNLANEWWGQNFFPRGFPYVLSLYLGAPVLSLAFAGAAARRPPAGRLLLLALLGLALSLGRWGGVAPLVDVLPALRVVRFPVKAFFTVHLAVTLLAALGLQALGDGRCRKAIAAAAGVLGTLLVSARLLPVALPGPMSAFASAFFPPGFLPEARAVLVDHILADAAVGGLVALGVGTVALLAWRGSLSGPRAAVLVAALVAADLLRAGAGLNPMVSADFFLPSPELEARLPSLREGRVYTCPVETSPAYLAARVSRGRNHEAWSFAVLFETLSPAFNVPLGVATALSPDLTMLVPTDRILPLEAGSCRNVTALLPRWREAAVSTVLSLDPLEHPELEPLFVLAPQRIMPLAVHAYRLRDPLPRVALLGPGRAALVRAGANRLEITTEAEAAATLVVRDAWAPGWTARVGDREARPLAPGRDRRVEVPAGTTRVVMSYRPPHLGPALLASALALALVGWLLSRGDPGPVARVA